MPGSFTLIGELDTPTTQGTSSLPVSRDAFLARLIAEKSIARRPMNEAVEPWRAFTPGTSDQSGTPS